MELTEKVARAIRMSYDGHAQGQHGDPPLTPWDEIPEPRKRKWLGMAAAAIIVMEDEATNDASKPS